MISSPVVELSLSVLTPPSSPVSELILDTLPLGVSSPIVDSTLESSEGVSVEFGVVATATKVVTVSASTSIQFDTTIFKTFDLEAATTLNLSPLSHIDPITDLTNLVIHGADNHQKNDTAGPQGGEIDYTKKLMTGPVPILAPIQFVSQDNSDVDQVYSVEGIGNNRIIESELIRLNGSAVVFTSKSFRRLCSITKISGSPLTGDVTVYAGASIIGVMSSDEGTNCPETSILVNLLPNAMGQANVDTVFYEKFFIKNKTNTDISTLTISEHQSDFNERIWFAESGIDDNSTSDNRATAPNGISDLSTDTSVTVEDVIDGSSVGIWVKVLIPAGEATALNTWKIKLNVDGTETIVNLLHREAFGETGSLIFSKRNLHAIGGGNPLQYIERGGAKIVTQSYYEPDPVTFRDQFYYNTRLNRLFKKINTKPTPVWKIAR